LHNSESPQNLLRATALLLFSSVGFGSLSTLVLLTERAGLALLPAMLWRYLLAVIVLFAITRRKTRSIPTRRAAQLVIIGGCGQALITYLSLKALDYIPVGPLAFLFYTYPAWVAIIGSLTGREHLTPKRVIALAIAMIGIAVMVETPKESLNTFGVVLALGVAFVYALYLPALHRVQAGIRPDVATLYLLVGVLASFLAASIVSGSITAPTTFDQWKYVLLLSLVSTVMAFSMLIAGLRVMGPVRTSIISTIEPFFTSTLGVLVLGQRFSNATLAGGALVAVAVVLLQLSGGAKESDAARI
jgi:drug/metabolite transporter (DMT)-like permease